MKFKELQSLKSKDLEAKESEIKMELLKLRSQVATGTALKSPGQVKVLKKTLARISMIKSLVDKESKSNASLPSKDNNSKFVEDGKKDA